MLPGVSETGELKYSAFDAEEIGGRYGLSVGGGSCDDSDCA